MRTNHGSTVATRERSGLETLHAIRDGVLPPDPMSQLLRMELLACAEGRVEFGCAVDESVYNPFGVAHGGLVATLLDTVAGLAVFSTLPPGAGFTSIELTVNFVRAVRAPSGPLTAVGTLIRCGRRVAFADGHVRDTAGQTVATATSALLIITPTPDGPGNGRSSRHDATEELVKP
jgi:uncharacterized protein (TIGR00369 family)